MNTYYENTCIYPNELYKYLFEIYPKRYPYFSYYYNAGGCIALTHLSKFLSKDHLIERITRIKNGDFEERDRFIQDYIPFIIKDLSNILNKYIESENSDEYMIGLEAFNEAIDKFDFSRGNFLSFASLVIRSRIIDYMRKNNSAIITTSIDQYDENDILGARNKLEINLHNENIDLQLELMVFKEKLNDFDITFCDLVENCPKHNDTRSDALKTARYIVEHKEEKEFLYSKKRLPYLTLVTQLGISRKFFDRNKTFIIASVLILDSDLDIIKTYICDAERRSKNDL